MINKKEVITLAHGSGGRATSDLIHSVILKYFGYQNPDSLQDYAKLNFESNTNIAFTTDSFVVNPIFFPGGDIGTLAVNGTVNDLSVGGSFPLYLSCAFIIEEGLEIDDLQKIVISMSKAAQNAGTKIVTGDVKVVEKGAADKIYINTTGIGSIYNGVNIDSTHAQEGDDIIVSGYIGDHGAAIIDARGNLKIDIPVESDCKPVNKLIKRMIDVCSDIHCLRDATRGGVATVLNEIAMDSKICIQLEESSIPVRDTVKGMCELLGFDPLYLANEGTIVAVVPNIHTESILKEMKKDPAGEDSCLIGKVTAKYRGNVSIRNAFGSERIIDIMYGDQLPRIC
jgi:hydrogenase expression/formation protein HypE